VPSVPQIELMLTMEPPCAFISFIAVRVPQKVPSTEVVKLARQSAVEVESSAPQV
jgi:hypothetical protein